MAKEDERFSKISTDPRFSEMSRKKSTVKIDKRFSKMFKDENFKFTHKFDKFGRRIKKSTDNDRLKQKYKFGDDKNNQKNVKNEFENDKNELKMAKKSTESDENVSENTFESDENELKIEKHLTENDENGYENDENKLKMEKKSTNKIAVVKQDWSVLRAVDVLAILSSCLPSRNFIKSVVVYPTKYGLKRMKKETKKGPKNIWKKSKIDYKKLKKYEKKKLKYYFALVTCDNSKTAEVLIKRANGVQFQNCDNRMNLQLVPENQNFEDIKERDKAFKIPNDYKAPTFFQSALSHSNTKFTWDMNDPKRDYLLRANSNNDPKIEDYAEFLGSSEENDFLDETINGELKNNKTKNEDFLNDDTKSREKLLSLIKNLKNKKETEEVVVKFQTGFDDKSENENRNDFESAEEKTNQLLENKKKLKKRKRVNAIRKREKKIENEKIKESKGFNLIKEKKKAKNSKTDSKNRPSKNEKSIENSSKSIKNNFEIDLKDKRFEALKKDSNFSIDPSNPQFKKTDQMKNLIRKMNTENETEKRKVEDVSMKSLMKKLKSKLHKND